MTVGKLKEYLNRFDDRADIFYFDSESGEDRPLRTDWLTIEDSFEDKKIKEEVIKDMDSEGYVSKYCINEMESLQSESSTIIKADAPKRRKGTPLEENDFGYNCENWIP